MESLKKLGIEYSRAHAQEMERLEKSNALLANYDPTDFTHALKGLAALFFSPDSWKL